MRLQGHKYNTVKFSRLDLDMSFSQRNRRMPLPTHSYCINFLKDHTVGAIFAWYGRLFQRTAAL